MGGYFRKLCGLQLQIPEPAGEVAAVTGLEIGPGKHTVTWTWEDGESHSRQFEIEEGESKLLKGWRAPSELELPPR